MSLTIELSPDVEARFRAESEARGVSLSVFVAEWLTQHAPAESKKPLTHEEAEKRFDEFLDTLPDLPVLSDEALRRENLYVDEEST